MNKNQYEKLINNLEGSISAHNMWNEGRKRNLVNEAYQWGVLSTIRHLTNPKNYPKPKPYFQNYHKNSNYTLKEIRPNYFGHEFLFYCSVTGSKLFLEYKNGRWSANNVGLMATADVASELTKSDDYLDGLLDASCAFVDNPRFSQDKISSQLSRMRKYRRIITRLKEEKEILLQEILQESERLKYILQYKIPSYIENIPLIPYESHNESGVYFLIETLLVDNISFPDVVYVGQAQDIRERVKDHKREGVKNYSYVLYTPCPKNQLNEIEQYWIRKLQPPLNKSYKDGYPCNNKKLISRNRKRSNIKYTIKYSKLLNNYIVKNNNLKILGNFDTKEEAENFIKTNKGING